MKTVSLGEICRLAGSIACQYSRIIPSAVKVNGAAFSGISANLYQTILIHAIIQLSS